MTTKQFSVLSLFTGVGGLDYGFEAAGFETRVALERDRAAKASARAAIGLSLKTIYSRPPPKIF